MKIEIKLRIAADDGTICEEEVLSLDKPHDQLEAIGLSLAEAKDLLGSMQEHIVARARLSDEPGPHLFDRRRRQRAHLLLQTRTRALDGTLRGKFEQWYPGLAANNSAPQLETAMAA